MVNNTSIDMASHDNIKSRLVSDVNDNNERSISFKDDIPVAVDATPDDDEFDEYNKHFRQSTVSFAMNANRLAEGEYDDDDDDTNALRPSRNYNSRRESNRSNISQLTESEVKRKRLSMWKFESYELPQSTYTLLISEPVLSRAFLMGIVAAVLSIMSLSIVLVSELDNGTADSPLGLPTGVPPEVRMAQYLGVMIGVLMEEEVPLGLEIIGKCVEQNMMGRRPFKMRKVIFSSILRMVVGYLFLTCLFMTVIQENDVLNIFFDVLALEFVEKLDDILHSLLKRGFFGKTLRLASYEKRKYRPPGDAGSTRFAKWMNRFVRLVYFMNGIIMLVGLTILTVEQDEGNFRCKTLSIYFSDDVWEDAYVRKPDGSGYDKRLLIYSHFNGVYVENGTHDGRPKYTEQNKEDGSPFLKTIGAEIIYCDDIESWVFKHDLISTSPCTYDDLTGECTISYEEENECSWLLRSEETDSFDVIEVASERDSWKVWTGLIEDDSSITIDCNECYSNAGCNYHGDCGALIDQRCECNEGYFGIHCEYETPCRVIRSTKDDNTTLELLLDDESEEDNFVQVYGHPTYTMKMSGIPTGLMKMGEQTDDYYADDDFFEIHTQYDEFNELLNNYTFVLKYTGRRWYGQIYPERSSKGFDEEEYHAFWNRAFSGVGIDDNRTVIISAPTTDSSPVGVDFYEMRRRNKQFEGTEKNYNYGPFGVLLNNIGAEGAGYFHCNIEEDSVNRTSAHTGTHFSTKASDKNGTLRY